MNGMEKNIQQIIQPEQIRSWLRNAFSDAGVNSVELLKNDHKVQQVALAVYDRIPLVPFRAIIKATIGKDGFTSFVFRVRDKMVQAGSTDLSWLSAAQLKSLLSEKRDP